MDVRSPRDVDVMAECKRRNDAYLIEYHAKSAWLRLPFYGVTVLCVIAAVLMPGIFLPYIAGTEVI